jgi:hypothetical protein
MSIADLNVNFDITDPKRKLFAEAWDLFRRATNLQEAIHMMHIHYSFMSDEKRKVFYTAALALLEKEREVVITNAIEKYHQHKNYGL